jgi:hypothetical protein
MTIPAHAARAPPEKRGMFARKLVCPLCLPLRL